MTATLQFHLPDDRHEHLAALHGAEAFRALRDIDNQCRNVIKHGAVGITLPEHLAEHIRREIADTLALMEVE